MFSIADRKNFNQIDFSRNYQTFKGKALTILAGRSWLWLTRTKDPIWNDNCLLVLSSHFLALLILAENEYLIGEKWLKIWRVTKIFPDHIFPRFLFTRLVLFSEFLLYPTSIFSRFFYDFYPIFYPIFLPYRVGWWQGRRRQRKQYRRWRIRLC